MCFYFIVCLQIKDSNTGPKMLSQMDEEIMTSLRGRQGCKKISIRVSITIFCLAILYRFSKTEYRYLKKKKNHTGFMAVVSFRVHIPTAREQSSSLNLNSDGKY